MSEFPRRAAGMRAIAAGVLLAGPAVLAFASGGYFAEARLWAAAAACLLAAVAALAADAVLPRSAAGRIALAGLAGLLAWTLASRAWAPVVGAANVDAQRLALYLAGLVAAAALLRGAPARWAEPALAAGILAVIGYGLSERLAPGLVDLEDIRAASGRLSQPLTYWNATGALAGIGIVLAARLAGDARRPRGLGIAAAAAAAPLGAGLLLAFSRGAIAATVVGLAVLLALASSRAELRAVVVVAATAVVSGAVAAALPAARTLEGGSGRRELEGAVLAAALVLAASAAALAIARLSRAEAGTASARVADRRGEEARRAVSDRHREAARHAVSDRHAEGAGRAVSDRHAEGAGRAVSDRHAEATRRAVSDRPAGADPPPEVVRRTAGGRPWSAHRTAVIVGVACAVGLVLAAAAVERGPGGKQTRGATAARLGSAESNRYAYWRVAVRGFADAPLRGHGSGSFPVLWLRHRTVAEGVRDAHSLELETAAELGLVGLALLAALIGGVARCAIVAARRDAAAVAGPVAALAAWAAHSALDWDWEMPALTLVAIALAGLVVARADATDARPGD